MDRRRPLDSPRFLEPLGQTRRRPPEAKTEGRPPARLPSLSTPRQSNDDALPPVKRGVAALSPLNAVTPDARPVGMRRHFFDEPGPPLVTPQPSEPKSFDTADARPPRSRPTPAARRGLPPRDPLARNTPQPRVAELGLKLDKIRLGAEMPDVRGRGRSASPADLSRRSFEPAAPEIFERGRTRSPADLSEILERGRSASPADFLPARGGQSPRDFLPARSRSPADFASGKYLPADLRSQSPRGPGSHGSLTPRAAAPKYLPADLSGSGGQRRRPSWDHRP